VKQTVIFFFIIISFIFCIFSFQFIAVDSKGLALSENDDPYSDQFYEGNLQWNDSMYEIKYQINGSQKIFEDDIILFNTPIWHPYSNEGPLQKAVPDPFLSLSMKWPDGIIPYKIDRNIQLKNIKLFNNIKDAMNFWDDKTVIDFIKLNETNSLVYPDYVFFKYSPYGCKSPVGKNPTGGKQIIEVNSNCSYGKILHEIAHLMGLWHEQSRPDRDQHVQIIWDNIDINKLYNFNSTRCLRDPFSPSSSKVCESLSDIITPYDYCSIMHYGSRAFLNETLTNDPNAVTIKVKPPNKVNGCELGQRTAPSQYDIYGINKVYS
jgi:hypothetical protein